MPPKINSPVELHAMILSTKGVVFVSSIVDDRLTKGAFNACTIARCLAGSKALVTAAFDAWSVMFDGLDPMVADSEAVNFEGSDIFLSLMLNFNPAFILKESNPER